MRKFQALCDILGIPLAHKKNMGPTTCIIFLGIELDSQIMQLRLPEDKIDSCHELLQSTKTKRTMTLRKLQSLIGSLSFACTAIQPGKTFLRRMIDLTMGKQIPDHYITLNAEARADMACWLECLENFNGKTMFIDETWLSNRSIKLFTDSTASHGYGAVLGKRWSHGLFPPQWSTYNITFLELVPIVVALQMWGHLLRNHSVLLMTDRGFGGNHK